MQVLNFPLGGKMASQSYSHSTCWTPATGSPGFQTSCPVDSFLPDPGPQAQSQNITNALPRCQSHHAPLVFITLLPVVQFLPARVPQSQQSSPVSRRLRGLVNDHFFRGRDVANERRMHPQTRTDSTRVRSLSGRLRLLKGGRR